jgi:hypothetical protein
VLGHTCRMRDVVRSTRGSSCLVTPAKVRSHSPDPKPSAWSTSRTSGRFRPYHLAFDGRLHALVARGLPCQNRTRERPRDPRLTRPGVKQPTSLTLTGPVPQTMGGGFLEMPRWAYRIFSYRGWDCSFVWCMLLIFLPILPLSLQTSWFHRFRRRVKFSRRYVG